jgi:hypothetical protein
MSGLNPDYVHKLTERDGKRVVLIIDLNLGAMSVTNGAEKVLAEINANTAGQGIVGAKVYYRDSELQWDELVLTPAGTFETFKALGRETQAWCMENGP